MQSTNEELETSKEELQSLNEELTTVNAQLQAKMEELERTTNDLGSLLSSTDIAVIFLDPKFRIRRYTPAVKALIDLIPSDVSRPLLDLRRKFVDPELLADAQAVLDKLIPVEREVAGDAGRHYVRRVLPYRTSDNRIDGVGVTFVDVTDRRRAEADLRASEERQAFLLRLADALRPLADPAAIKAEASRVLGEYLRVNRAFYAEVEGNDWVVTRGYEQGVGPLPDGPYAADTYGPWVMQTYRDGGRIVFRDTRTDPRFSDSERDAHATVGILGAVGVPLIKGGTLVAILAVHTAAPRDWTDGEVELIEEVAERTWAAVERARAEAGLAAEKEYAESIVQTLHEPLLVLHPDLTVQSVNPAFYSHFRVDPADTIGRKVYELGNGQWDIPALRKL